MDREAQPPRVVLGRIVGAHGLDGQVRVRYFGDGPENLLRIENVWLGESREDTEAAPYVIRGGGTGRAGEVRLVLKGLRYRDEAMALRGSLILADPTRLQALEEGEFYWHELVGCRAEGTDGTQIGTVVEIWDTGAHDVVVVEDANGKRHLLSTARELMPEIDLEGRRIVVEMLPGILEAEGDPTTGPEDGKRKKKRKRREQAKAKDIAAHRARHAQAEASPGEVPGNGQNEASEE